MILCNATLIWKYFVSFPFTITQIISRSFVDKDECVDFRNKCDAVMNEPLKSFKEYVSETEIA